MPYLSEGDLRKAARSGRLRESARRMIRKDASTAETTIFLCHSHKDHELAEGLINLLGGYGIDLYVDWKDTEMPDETSRKTADKIKQRIHSMDYFLVLATKNGMQSRWVPWEIGVADNIQSHDRIGIIPVYDQSGIFHGNEYLQLYKRIEISDKNRLAVFNPGQSEGSFVKSWLTI